MLILQGAYNKAHIMIDEVDLSTISQIYSFLNNEAFKDSYIAIMPDCHKGVGSCIGFTMQMKEIIIPSIVGVDIGCGMLSCKFDVDHIGLEDFDNFIKQNIPSGFSINKNPWRGNSFFNFKEILDEIDISYDRAYCSIGTLGGGNHFIEAGYGSDGKLWVTIHSGSRNFGLKIATAHQKIAKIESKKGELSYLKVDSSSGQKYIEHQKIGVEYASINRKEMMQVIEKFIGKSPIESIESKHNFIDETGMIRKGATPAHKGQKLIIPFNMRDGIAICVGKGNKDYNYSAPHGAGRILSRAKAKETLDVEYFKANMKDAGVYTTTAGKDTIDESPEAYKNMSIIIENIKPTVDIIEIVKPVYNFKAGGE